jgi:hypothetical protein
MTDTFVQTTREKMRKTAASHDVAGRFDSERKGTAPAVAEPGSLGEMLNQSPAVQAQIQRGRSLNQTPHAITHAKLAQRLSQRASLQPAPTTQQQVNDEDDILQEKAVTVQRQPAGEGNRALVARHLAPDRTNLRVVYSPTNTHAPIQGAWRDYIPSWSTVKDLTSRGIGGAIGGATAAYLAGTTGSLLGGAAGILGGVAGLTLGAPAAAAAAGIALGGAAGWQLGSTAASYLGSAAAPYLGGAISSLSGTVTGYLGSAASLAGGLTGAATGAVLGERVATQVGKKLPAKKADTQEFAPAIEDLIYNRAIARHEDPRLLLTHLERAQVQANIDRGAEQKEAITRALESHYRLQIAQHSQYAADTTHNAALTNILRQNPFIQRLLNGDVHESIGAAKDPTLPRSNLAFGPLAPVALPQAATDAVELFNELVTVGANPVTDVRKNSLLDPISSMEHGGVLNVGRPAPRGILLHELGHHLEFNLSPIEFASVHNFLMSRSKGNKLREVGYGRLAGLPGGSRGYDTEGPSLSGSTASEFVLSALAERTNLGKGSGAEEFIRSRASDPISSYATKVYPGTMDTEFISTTIAYFDNPASAEELVQADPLRVCLFLSLARPDDYAWVQARFDMLGGLAGRMLNDRIHKIT